MLRFAGTIIALSVMSVQAIAEVKMEVVDYKGWKNSIKLSNGKVELIATTDVGPRIIRFGFVGGQNLFGEYDAMIGKTGASSWMIYGGHRFWHAPEVEGRTYSLDNSPVSHEWDGKTLKLRQAVEKDTGIEKQMDVTLDPNSNKVTVVHRAINRNYWDVELAPWGLTVMAKSGRGIFPQEEYRPHPDYFLPARPLVLWHYTNMSDPRFTWGEKFIQLRQDPKATTKQKFGFLNKQGWIAYELNGEVFVKHYAHDDNAQYPDYGCNTESYTDQDMLEMETLGALSKLAAQGGSAEHTETWDLFKAEIGKDDASIEKTLLPLIKK